MANPSGVVNPGDIFDCVESEARALVAAGYALAVDNQKDFISSDTVEIETAEILPVETAEVPKRRKGKRWA